MFLSFVAASGIKTEVKVLLHFYNTIWFFSMILSKNAFTGYTFEHSWGDGVAGNVLIKVYLRIE